MRSSEHSGTGTVRAAPAPDQFSHSGRSEAIGYLRFYQTHGDAYSVRGLFARKRAVTVAWIKLEASVARNRKFVKAGPAPSWLWVCGLAYCQEGLTDGFIPTEALPYLGVKNAPQLAAHLVAAGLWEQAEGGWQVHDYLLHNRPALEIRGIQQERRRAGTRGGVASGQARNTENRQNAEQNAESAKQIAEANVVDPTKQVLNPSTATTTATATATQTPTQPLAPLHDRSHMKHAHCGRVCLPAPLFSEFVRRRNHANADREVRDWALRIDQAWQEGGPHANDEPGDAWAFWKARYDEQWPAMKPQAATGPTYVKAKDHPLYGQYL